MYSLQFTLQFASGKSVDLYDGDGKLEGIFPTGPAIERLKYKGEPFTGTLRCTKGDWTLDFVDGLEHGYFRGYNEGFMLEEYRYAFGVQYGIAKERDYDGLAITQATFDFGPEPDHFDPYLLVGGLETSPLRVDFHDPFIQIQDAPDLTVALDCLFYRGRPFTGILVQRSDDGDWVETEFYMGFVQGSSRAYHPNGQLKTELFYKYDRPFGTQFTWDISGEQVGRKEHGEEPFGPKHIYGRIWNSEGDVSRYKLIDVKEFWCYSMLQRP